MTFHLPPSISIFVHISPRPYYLLYFCPLYIPQITKNLKPTLPFHFPCPSLCPNPYFLLPHFDLPLQLFPGPTLVPPLRLYLRGSAKPVSPKQTASKTHNNRAHPSDSSSPSPSSPSPPPKTPSPASPPTPPCRPHNPPADNSAPCCKTRRSCGWRARSDAPRRRRGTYRRDIL